jgi:hypothetical protein
MLSYASDFVLPLLQVLHAVAVEEIVVADETRAESQRID